MKIDAVKFLIANSATIARLVAAHGAKPPQLTGEGTIDRDKIGAWMAYVSLLAHREEPIAHNGATFETRVLAAKELHEAWERMHKTQGTPDTTSERPNALPHSDRSILDDAWSRYVAQYLPSDVCTAQLHDTEHAFFSGAIIIFTMMTLIGKLNPPERVTNAMLNTIESELGAFKARFRAAARAAAIKKQAEGRGKRG